MALRGGGAGPVGLQIRCICPVFAHSEALSLDSQSLKVTLSDKNAYEMTLRGSGWSRSGSDHFRILLDLQETSRSSTDDPQMIPT